MEIVKLALYVLILFTSIPVGRILAKICREELKPGKFYFKIFLYCIAVLLAASIIIYRNLILIMTLAYAAGLIFIMLLKNRKIKE